MSQKPMTIVIADDDPVFREYLRLILSPMTDVHIAAVFEDAFETLKYLQTNAVDLALLDVEMPGLTGLELARSLQVKPMFMFITSHPGYALEGFDVEAIDYILKPIQKERVYKAIQKDTTAHATEAGRRRTPARTCRYRRWSFHFCKRKK
jgi:Response regulator of the LytR/AlgR family